MVSDIAATSVSWGATSDVREPATATAAASTKAPDLSIATIANPQSQLDPSLNIVVLQFRNSAGEIVNSIPTQSQLNAYQLNYATSSVSSSSTI